MPRVSITRARPYTPKRGAFAGRTFHSEREYRNALAQRRGFSSWHAQQRSRPAATSARAITRLSTSAREARGRSLEALSLMRRDGMPLTEAAKRSGTTTNTVLRHAGPALERDGGRYRARPGDHLTRLMLVIARDLGPVTVAVRGSRQASVIGAYWNAVNRYVAHGDPQPLRRFTGVVVAGVELETDLDVIDGLARAGELEFEDIYEGVA